MALKYIDGIPVTDGDSVSGVKKIHRINITKNFGGYINNTVPQSGGVETIEIIGDPGAGFSLTLTDSNKDCSILQTPLDNVSIPFSNKGFSKYSFSQTFPPSVLENKYDMVITPSGGSILGDNIPKTIPTYSIKQYVNPLQTFSVSTETDADFVISDTTTYPHPVSLKGTAGAMYRRRYNKYRGARDITSLKKTDGEVNIDFQITKKGGAGGYLYIFNQPKTEDWINSDQLTKIVNKEFSGGGKIRVTTTSGIKKGMEFEGEVSVTKAVLDSKYITDCNTSSDTLILNNVKDIDVRSSITSERISAGYLDVGGLDEDVIVRSIDEPCNTIIVSRPLTISKGSLLTFTRTVTGKVRSIIDEFWIELGTPADDLDVDNYFVKHKKRSVNLKNEGAVFTNASKIPNGTVLKFDKPNKSSISSNINVTAFDENNLYGGVVDLYVKGTITVEKFGLEDVTMNLDLDNIISYKPNAYEQNINIVKNTAYDFDLFALDKDANLANKSPSIVTNPQHGTLSTSFDVGVGLLEYTPTTNYTGADFFEFKVSDGTTDSDTKKINITVN